MAGLDALILQVEALMAGEVAGATYPITAGHFVRADDATPLERYFEGGATRRPFVVQPMTAKDALGDEEENVTGTLVDATYGLAVKIAYLAGGGSLGQADARGVASEQAKDWRRLRRCLAHPDNWDEQVTGAMNVSLGTATFGQARPEGSLRISILTIPLTAMVREDWTQEP